MMSLMLHDYLMSLVKRVGDCQNVCRRLIQSLKEILNEVRRMGNLKVYACTAAVKLMELEEDKVKSRVDDILGLTTL